MNNKQKAQFKKEIVLSQRKLKNSSNKYFKSLQRLVQINNHKVKVIDYYPIQQSMSSVERPKPTISLEFIGIDYV